MTSCRGMLGAENGIPPDQPAPAKYLPPGHNAGPKGVIHKGTLDNEPVVEASCSWSLQSQIPAVVSSIFRPRRNPRRPIQETRRFRRPPMYACRRPGTPAHRLSMRATMHKTNKTLYWELTTALSDSVLKDPTVAEQNSSTLDYAP